MSTEAPDRWQSKAACLDADPSLFDYPDSDSRYGVKLLNEAKRICAGCPVRMSCLADAQASLDNGIRGGFVMWQGRIDQRYSDAKPKAAKPTPPFRRREVAECGTRAGFMRHRDRIEPACEPCRAAERAYQLQWRRARRAKARSAA